VIRLAAACHSFHLASPSPPQPCSWPGRTHSLPLHALAMSVVKLGIQPDSFPAGLLWCSPGATRYLRTRPVRQVVMARPTARLHMHAAWRLPAWCASPFAIGTLLPSLPSATRAGSGIASGSGLSPVLTSQASAFSASDASAVHLRIALGGHWTANPHADPPCL